MQKLKKYISLIRKNCNFYLLRIIFFKVMTKISSNNKYFEKKAYYIEKNISKKCETVLNKFDLLEKETANFEDKIPNTIWILWWQGIENAPHLVKNCIESIKRNNSDYDVKILTESNINSYITLDEVIMKKFTEGKIKFACFSDIIRVNLLSKYGGIWCDSTIWCNKALDHNINNYEFYSVKLDNNNNKCIYVSKLRWVSYFLCAKKNNMLMKFIVEMFNEYFKYNDYIIDYFLIDYIIDIAVNRYEYIKEMIENVPVNNKNIENLIFILNETYNKEKYQKVTEDTYLFKLNYKTVLSENANTVYNKIIFKKLK